ncbi:MAG: hypothetical protein KVP17_000099 [Porospora cf. gigantea B]|nr:MAG: hypothetical protein KVP17_000099 [Porospora cf. gigantea B]
MKARSTEHAKEPKPSYPAAKARHKPETVSNLDVAKANQTTIEMFSKRSESDTNHPAMEVAEISDSASIEHFDMAKGDDTASSQYSWDLDPRDFLSDKEDNVRECDEDGVNLERDTHCPYLSIWDPDLARDPPFLTNSEMLGRVDLEADLQAINLFFVESAALPNARAQHDFLKRNLHRFKRIVRCPHCGSRVMDEQFFSPRNSLFPSGFYMTCCYDHARSNQKKAHLGGSKVFRLVILPPEAPELPALEPRFGQRYYEGVPKKRKTDEGPTASYPLGTARTANLMPRKQRTAGSPEARRPPIERRLLSIEEEVRSLKEQMSGLILLITNQLNRNAPTLEERPEVVGEVEKVSAQLEAISKDLQDIREDRPAPTSENRPIGSPPRRTGKPVKVGRPRTFAEVVAQGSFPQLHPAANVAPIKVQTGILAAVTRPPAIPVLLQETA